MSDDAVRPGWPEARLDPIRRLHVVAAGLPNAGVGEITVDVHAVLASLSPDQRAVLVLRDLDGLAEAEVAALLSIPEGTVKSRLHRARGAFARRWSA